MTLLLAAAATAVLARWWRNRRAAADAVRHTERTVPDLVELLVVLVRAGLTPALAFRRLAAVPPPAPFGPAVDAVIVRLDTGERFADSLIALIDAHGPMLEPLVSLLAPRRTVRATRSSRSSNGSRPTRARTDDAPPRSVLVACPCSCRCRSCAAPCPPSWCSPSFPCCWGPSRRSRTSTRDDLRHPGGPTMHHLLALWIRLQHPADHDDTGQATAEYALVLLGAALVALLLVAWATGGGGGKIGQLLDTVVDSITSRI